MSDKIKDGGPAFPVSTAEASEGHQDGHNTWQFPGMTLRDHFAGLAMQGIVGSIDSEDNYRRMRGHASAAGLSVSEWIARDAYKQADAMLKAREAE